MQRLSPFYSMIRTVGYVMSGRLYFPYEKVGEKYRMEDGKAFTVFRHAIVDGASNEQNTNFTLSKVRFLVPDTRKNIMFSLLTLPFIIGLPGFRAKLWMISEENGCFQGIYEWNSTEDAEKYSQSYAVDFMKRRSIPGSISYEIMPSLSLKEYLGTLKRL